MQKTVTEDAAMKMKVCLVGDFAVGKTSLVRRFVVDAFDDRYVPTIGTKVTKKELVLNSSDNFDGRLRVVMTLWDIMGERGVRDPLTDAYLQGTHGILAVCDVTRAETLANLSAWRKSVENAAGKVPAYVLANKVDLEGEAVLTSAHVEATDELRDCPSVMTSAKTGNGVEAAFQGLANLILESRLTKGAAALKA